MRLYDRFRQWMVGRYGNDQLNFALIIGYFLFYMLFAFTRWSIFLILSNVLFLLLIFRTFSKNISKRYEENQKFLRIYGSIASRFGRNSAGYSQPTRRQTARRKPKTDKDHKIFQCGKCGQMIRVPKGKGKIAIICPKCGQEFIKRT